jgi:hypothetical protein
MKDFFISYNGKDKHWAEWIAATLTKAGFTLTIQSWDFRPGSNFVLQMHQASIECNCTIAVLSPNWLASVFTQPEWTAAFALDPTGTTRKLVPVRVQACEPAGLLRTIVYCDLVGLAEDDAREQLLRAVNDAPSPRPSSAPFPGALSATEQFPGASHSRPRNRLPNTVKCAFDLFGLLQTTRTTFEAQARLRDTLVRQIHERLILDPYRSWQFEEFFSRYYPELDAEERRIFSTIRSFTTGILSDYNRRLLALIEACPNMANEIRSIAALKRHLLVWLAKFEGTFLATPSMCLLYTGVDEGVPFPSDLDRSLWEYLNRKSKFRELLHGEPEPGRHFEEHGDESPWRFQLRKKWERKRIAEIAAERAGVLDERRAGELDRELAELTKSLVYSWKLIPVPATLISSLQALAALPDPGWTQALRTSLDSVRPAINEFNATRSIGDTNLKILLAEIVTIVSQVRSLRLESPVLNEWNRFRDTLIEWAFATLQ